MSAKNTRLTILLLAFFLIAAFAVLSAPKQAFAAHPTDVDANSCLSCHEDLYYLHDEGCWYCMTDAHKDRCVDCHLGNPAAFKEEDAHFGLIAHPQENDGAQCKQCHAEDFQARIDTFAIESGGFAEVIEPVAYTPAQPAETGFPATEPPGISAKLPWVAGAVVLFGFWLALVLFSPHKL
jgi:hypothetical protein